jgi:hypothetical protein
MHRSKAKVRPMHVRYDDITRRIAEPPRWWCRGVPRYDDFEPSALHVYADTAVLARVECQGCGKPFMIGEFSGGMGRDLIDPATNRLAYFSDDPPNHDDCTGNTMGWEMREIVQAWRRHDLRGWFRRPDLEGPRD